MNKKIAFSLAGTIAVGAALAGTWVAQADGPSTATVVTVTGTVSSGDLTYNSSWDEYYEYVYCPSGYTYLNSVITYDSGWSTLDETSYGIGSAGSGTSFNYPTAAIIETMTESSYTANYSVLCISLPS